MKNPEFREIGKRISRIRNYNEYSQEQLAEKLSLTPKHISNIESGTVGISLGALTKLCRLFDCSMDYIVFGRPMNDDINKLPKEIISIIYSGSREERQRLDRHLKYFIDLIKDFEEGDKK